VRFAQVVGNEFRLAGGHIGVALFENSRNPGMQLLAPALE
jgi:hypothetical protein